MYLLDSIEGWMSSMMEPLEARVLLAADLPALDSLLFVRDGGDGRIVVADSDYDDQSVVVLRLTRDGTPDPTFGPLGIVRVRGLATVSDLQVQPDGKTLILGDLVDGRVGVVRLTTDGRFDETFGDGGLALAPDGPVDYWSIVSGRMALGRDGRIVIGEVAADATDASALYVSRFSADGRPDPTFGVGGITLIHTPLQLSELDAIYLRPDGGIDVSVQPLGSSGGIFARLHADGSPDASFVDGGILPRDLGGSYYDWHTLPDGRTLAYEQPPSAATDDAPRLHAYDRDGRADPSFGAGGVAEFPGTGPYVPMSAPAIRSGDRTILALYTSNPIFGHLKLIAIDDDGSVDAGWAFDGQRNLLDDAGVRGEFIDLAIADNGDLLTARLAYDAADPYDDVPLQLVIDRFRPDGTPEYDFGLGGEVTLELAAPGEFHPEDPGEPAPVPAPSGNGPQTPDADKPPVSESQGNPPQATAPLHGFFATQPIEEGSAARLLLGATAERSLFGDTSDEVFAG